ncbi:hydrophobic surface binding protein A-domain-containing protein [Pseudomassariella vexata]|uniref:Hydrophobic surface binding protein A-domain-containing protein n=1 Tax=Pseudomassariella vexata TaxID=1141098 RepID=A0A1Y2DBK5_9PEZI|nr:hydrophobic surface binding protein A-domain-containing protein [Pseudomassariella vexata]ORY56649.1 hydrophobic surface binding protein A-domain-containing protein [Pseudomassariella vexata]
MKFFHTCLSLFILTRTALADGAAIVTAMDSISQSNAALNSTIVSWNGDLLGTLPILTKSTTLLASLHDATKVAQASAQLNTIEAVTVAFATNDLVAETNLTLTNIIAARPKFDELLLRPIILLSLNQQKEASDEFSAAVVEKVPEELRGAADALVAALDEVFGVALESYELF